MQKRIVFFTKEPIAGERVKALNSLLTIDSVEIAGIFVEQVIHLPFWKFLFRTMKRIKKGHIYLPEFVKNIFSLFLSQPSDDDSLDILDFARMHHIPIHIVKNIESEEGLKLVRAANADIGIIFGHRILNEKLFNIPKEGSINVHYGVLPRYAGSHTTFWALTEDAKEVGLTIHKVSAKVDAGDILLTKTIPVSVAKSSVLDKEVSKLAPFALSEAVRGLVSGSLNFRTADSGRKYWKPPGFFERIKYRECL